MLPTLHARDRRHPLPARLDRSRAAARRPGRRRPAGLRRGDPPRRPGAGPVPVPPQRQLPLGGRARPGPPGHRRRGEAARADRGGGEGRPPAGRPTAGRPAGASWPRPPCWPSPLTEVSVKARVGGVNDDAGRPATCRTGPACSRCGCTPGLAEPAPGVTVPVPAYLQPARGAWLTPVPLRGEHVVLEPLDMSHVDGLFAAIADDEVFEFLPRGHPGPRRGDGRAGRRGVADAPDRVPRCPYVTLDAAYRRGHRHHVLLRRPTRSTGASRSATP